MVASAPGLAPPHPRRLACADTRGVRIVGTSADPPRHTAITKLFEHRVDVPNLRSRVEDIPAIVAVLLKRQPDASRRVVRTSAMEALMRHEWPGNIRELESVLAAAAARAGQEAIAELHLPEWFRTSDEAPNLTPIEVAERRAILRSLSAHDGNKAAAAASLGLARSTLYRKIRAFQIESL